MSNFEILIKPQELKINVNEGDNLLKSLREYGVFVDSPCSGRGTCGKCIVRIEGVLPPVTEHDQIHLDDAEIADGCRLACAVVCSPGMVVHVTEEVASAKGYEHFKTVAGLVRENIAPPKQMNKLKPRAGYGIALDIGTTTVAAMLVSLENGSILTFASRLNPQRAYGADVISRINYGQKAEGLKSLNDVIVSCVNDIVDELVEKSGVAREHVRSMAVVANTTMLHLFLNYDPSSLGVSPFTPLFKESQKLTPEQCRVDLDPGTEVYILPLVSGFVGADAVAASMAVYLGEYNGNRLIIDFGTNSEILLGTEKGIFACAAAAGPAFEGAHIKYGMRATAGAISRVRISDAEMAVRTIDNQPAEGICGSGLIDAIAELTKNGIIERNGRIKYNEENPLAVACLGKNSDDMYEIRLAGEGEESVWLTQQDIREVQLAKGAISAGIQILCEEGGITENDIDVLYLAGAFGNHIDKRSAREIGIIPQLPDERIIPIGNAAIMGGALALLHEEMRTYAEEMSAGIKHLELNEHPDFQNIYVAALKL